jgi:hypothetical protein
VFVLNFVTTFGEPTAMRRPQKVYRGRDRALLSHLRKTMNRVLDMEFRRSARALRLGLTPRELLDTTERAAAYTDIRDRITAELAARG